MDIINESTGRFSFRANEWKRDLAPNTLQCNGDCIECGFCVNECPHQAIRIFEIPIEEYEKMSEELKRKDDKVIKDVVKMLAYSPLDCTGCGECVNKCPKKNLRLAATKVDKPNQQARFDYLYNLQKDNPKKNTSFADLPSSTPYFEFSGACAGCGQTKYVGMLSRIFQDNLVVVNATGCSSIYGGTLPYLPWKCSWVNPLFEDAAEVGLGVKLADDSNKDVWVILGDGAGYDIGFGGLDHVMSQNGVNINVLVLDNEGYSNTGTQASKATPKGRKQLLCAGGKTSEKKNILGAIKGAYGDSVFTAEVSMHNPVNVYKQLKDAAAFNGPSIVLARCHCIMNKYHKNNEEWN